MSDKTKTTVFRSVVIAGIFAMLSMGMNFLAEIPTSDTPEISTFGAILFFAASVIGMRYGREAFKSEKTA